MVIDFLIKSKVDQLAPLVNSQEAASTYNTFSVETTLPNDACRTNLPHYTMHFPLSFRKYVWPVSCSQLLVWILTCYLQLQTTHRRTRETLSQGYYHSQFQYPTMLLSPDV